MIGNFAALDQLAASRLVGFLDNKGRAGTEILFDRVGWAAVAQLGLGNASRARELFDIGISDLAGLDPSPSSVRALALFAQAVSLDGDPNRASEIAESAIQQGASAREQGWGGGQLDYALACVAAASGSTDLALEHLQSAINAGWDNFIYARYDPAFSYLSFRYCHAPHHLVEPVV